MGRLPKRRAPDRGIAAHERRIERGDYRTCFGGGRSWQLNRSGTAGRERPCGAADRLRDGPRQRGV